MIGEYFDKPEDDLEDFLLEKGILSQSRTNINVSNLGKREEQEDQWEMIVAFVAAFVNKRISDQPWNDVVGGNNDLIDEAKELFDANDMLDPDSDQLILLDFHISSRSVVEECLRNKKGAMSVLSILDVDGELKKYIEKETNGMYIMISEE